ncbi:MAG: hypothetical protein K2N35_14075 [Muribaculaceae bacterium]|nr:hypothetical protein [Muribaculaceae bacterium]
MKHPLTSKERRGLLAVAAAALLCISSGFIFRSCTYNSEITEISNNSRGSGHTENSVRAGNSEKAEAFEDAKPSKKLKRKKNSQKKKAPKSYPVRDPLSEPCD